DTVFLQGVPGLAPGYYTLLPAHYALLPGGILVQPVPGTFADAPPAQPQADGSVIASGFRPLSGTPGFSRYRLMGSQVFGLYSQIVPYSFTRQALTLAQQAEVPVRTPNDAGSVVLDATRSLALEGTGKFGGGSGGLEGNLDVSAPKIAVVSGGAVAPDASYLKIDAQALHDFGAASVLLGGTRSAGTDANGVAGTLVKVNATDVVVSTAGGAPLAGPEVLLAATNSVTVADGSVVRAEGARVADTSPLLLAGDGAMVRVSTGDRVPLSRTGSTGAAGTLDVGNAVSITANSLALDGARTVSLDAGARLSAKQLDL